MPDFETVKLRAPYWARIPDRAGDIRRTWIEDEFELVVPSVSRTDMTLVAQAVHTGKYAKEVHEFFHAEGRLWRPLRHPLIRGELSKRSIQEMPPIVCLSPERAFTRHSRLPFLTSPLRPELNESTDLMRRRGRKLAPDAFEQTAHLVAGLSDKLRLVDDILFQETRSPAWSIPPDDLGVRAVLPDYHEDLGFLVDARYGEDVLGEHRVIGQLDAVRVLEPSLLPDTVEADALAAFCLMLHKEAINAKPDGFDPRFQAEVDLLMKEALGAFEADMSIAHCYQTIERLAEWDDCDGPGDGLMAAPAYLAAAFRQHLAEFPPLALSAGDDIDAGTFRP